MVKKLLLHKNKLNPDLLEGEKEITFANVHFLHLFNEIFPLIITSLACFILIIFLSSGGLLSLQLWVIVIIATAWLVFHLFAHKEKSLHYTSIGAGLIIVVLFGTHLWTSWGDISGISFARSQPRLFVNLGFVIFAGLVFGGASWFLAKDENAEIKEKYLSWGFLPGSASLIPIYFLLRWLVISSGPSRPLYAFLLDSLNNILEITTVVASLVCFFLMSIKFIDWKDEGIRLTNIRLIATRDIFAGIGGEKQDFVDIRDIQNVHSNTKTYLRHWLDYGTITISTAVSDKKIEFERIKSPRELQKKIMDQVRELQKQNVGLDFRRMIETRILGGSWVTEEPKVEFPTSVTPGFLCKLGWLKENPLYNEKDRIVTWHKHPIFLLLVLLRPLAFLLLGLGLMATLMIGVFSSLILWGLSILLILFFFAWEAWEIEDHRNDLYILKPNEVVDIEKLPFGPEDQKTASLGNIVNISFETSFLGKILDYGNVLLETAGSKGKFTFDHVPKPKEVVKVIRTYQFEYKKGERERALKDALELLRAYEQSRDSRDKRSKEDIIAAIDILRSDFNSYFHSKHT